MKKKAIAIAAILTVCALAMAACGGSGGGNLISSAGQSTLLEGVKKAPAELNPYSVAYAYMAKQRDFSSYTLTTTGSTTAKKGIVSYTQTIKNTTIKNGDEYFQQAESDSMFVKMKHQVFVKEGKAVYRGGLSGELNVSERSAYKELYGVSPDDIGINGFILNETSVKYAERVSEEDGAYTYRFVLDGEAAGANAKKQMKQFGSLNDYPVFSELTLLLTVKNDWTPVTLVTECTYDISIAVLGNMTCTQKLESTFSDVNGSVTIPDAESFNEKIGTTPSVVVPGESDKSAFMQVVEAMAGYDYEQGMRFGIELEINVMGMPMSLPADVYVTYDPQAVADGNLLGAVNFRLDASFSGMKLVLGPGSELNIMGLVISLINPELTYIAADVTDISILYVGDGNLYVHMKQIVPAEAGGAPTETILWVESIGLGELVVPLLDLIDPNMDPLALFAKAEGMFDSVKTAEGYTMRLNAATLTAVNAAYIGFLASDPTIGALVGNLLGASVAGVELNIDMPNGVFGGLSVAVHTLVTADEGTEPSEITPIQLHFTVEGELDGELDKDAEKIAAAAADEAAAAAVRLKIKALQENMWLGDTFLARVETVRAEYEALTESQKALVTNISLLNDETDYNSLLWEHKVALEAAESFLSIPYEKPYEEWNYKNWKQVDDLEWRSNNLEPYQKEYIGDALEKYKLAYAAMPDHLAPAMSTFVSELNAKYPTVEGREFDLYQEFMNLLYFYESMDDTTKKDVTGYDELLLKTFHATRDVLAAGMTQLKPVIDGYVTAQTATLEELTAAWKEGIRLSNWYGYGWTSYIPEGNKAEFDALATQYTAYKTLTAETGEFTVMTVNIFKNEAEELLAKDVTAMTDDEKYALRADVETLLGLYETINYNAKKQIRTEWTALTALLDGLPTPPETEAQAA